MARCDARRPQFSRTIPRNLPVHYYELMALNPAMLAIRLSIDYENRTTLETVAGYIPL